MALGHRRPAAASPWFDNLQTQNSILFGFTASAATTYAVALLAVTPIVLRAAAVSAWRAGPLEPVVALRND